MEVAEHFIGAPSAHEFDDVGVHLAAEEGHRSARAQGASGYVARQQSEVGESCGGAAKGGREDGRGGVLDVGCRDVDRAQCGGGRCRVGA